MGMGRRHQRSLPQGETIDRFFSGFEVELVGNNIRLVPYGVHGEGEAQVAEAAEFAIVVPVAACGTIAGKLLSVLERPVYVDETGKIVVVQ